LVVVLVLVLVAAVCVTMRGWGRYVCMRLVVLVLVLMCAA
jgi:predicted small secreted protein